MQKYPKYISRDGYVGTFQYVDMGGFPIYRFPGGDSLVDEIEIKNGSDNRKDLIMKVKFVGFGGYMDTPCYEDENGKLYFDENDGRNGLNLYTGAWRDKDCNEICGEPYDRVTKPVECDEPFVRHAREFDYMMLSRYQSDCKYFLGYGNGYEGHLYFKEVNKHCDEMKKLYDSFSDEDKPEWLTAEQIEQYRTDMLELLAKKEVRA